MSLTRWVLRRPRSALLALILLAGSGWIAWRTLPRQEDPDFIRRGATVLVQLPGATPERLDTEVAAPLEDLLIGISELEIVESTARSGIVAFHLKIDETFTRPGEIWQKVRTKIDRVLPQLPPGASRPLLLTDRWDTFTFLLSLSSESVSTPELDRLTEHLGDHLRTLSGTGQVERFGTPGEVIEVALAPNPLRFHGLTREGVARVLGGDDVDAPAGATRTGGNRFLIQAGREWTRLDQIRQVVLRRGSEGQVVRLGDVAEVHRHIARPLRPSVRVNGLPAIALGIKVKKGFRVDQFTRKLRAALAAYPLPEGVKVQTLMDQGAFTETRIQTLLQTLLQSSLAVTVITALFLGILPGLLVASTLPLVALIVLALYRLLGFPIEQISISALVLSMGLLIDNAIVVAEHLTTRMGVCEDPEAAVLEGVEELRIPLLMSTMTTVSAFLPVLLMPGGAGEFVRSIGVGVTASLLVSYLLALTYTPALTLYFHRIAPVQALRFAQESPAYRRLLTWIAINPAPAAAGLLLLFLPLFGTFAGVERAFFPESDRQQLLVDVWLEGGTPREETLVTSGKLEAQILAHPGVAGVASFIGSNAPRVYYNQLTPENDTEEFVQMLVNLKDGVSPGEVTRVLDQDLSRELPGVQILARPFGQGPPFGAPIEVRVIGPSPRVRRQLAERLEPLLKAAGTLRGLHRNVGRDRLKARLLPDPAALGRLGLTPAMVAQTLRHRIDGILAGDLREGERRIPVLVRGPERGSTTPGQILRSAVPGGAPLATLGEPEVEPDFNALARRNGHPTLTLQAWPLPGLRPAQALASFRPQVDALPLPPGYRLEYGGEHHARHKSEGRLFGNLYLAVMGILLALFLEFEEPRLVFMILWTIPLCAAPAIAGLWITGQPLGFMALLGILALTGIVLNDAILLVDGFERARREGRLLSELVVEVTLGRTNHVLLTSLTTIAGFLPLAIFGNEFWAPLASAVVAGLSSITVLTLLLVPALYVLVLGGEKPKRSKTD
jgi:multidrug efflux pump subunit AcrB